VNLILAGLNHQTAPVELRERFYLAESRTALEALHRNGLPEVAILSTCNRLEIVASTDDLETGLEVVETFLADSQGSRIARLPAHLYYLKGQAVVEHLMRVACGLESLVLGETQILGQMAEALAQAHAAGTVAALLSRLFDAALHAGKRAHAETAISQHSLSVSHIAALLIKHQLGSLTGVRCLIIGAGEMAELAASALQLHGADAITVTNRTQAKAVEFARRLGIQAMDWQIFRDNLLDFDVVVAAASATEPIIRAEDVTLSENRRHPVLLVDIGVPRNIDEKVGALHGFQLYDIDDLSLVVDEHRTLRQAQVAHVEAIVAEEVEHYAAWLRGREVAPVIAELRRQAEALAQAEVEQALHRLPALNPHEQAIVSQMAYRIVNKMLHAPTVTLKSQAGQDDYVATVRQLFALDERRTHHE
jgi:glutamyl-tRNA reductase